MALIANLVKPYSVNAPDPPGVSAVIANRFPTPGRAIAFVTVPYSVASVLGVRSSVSALNPESPYLEPTIGQIWPR